MTKVSIRLTRALGTTEEDGVGALGGAEGKLIKGNAFAASLDDSSSGRFGEAKSSNSKLGNFQETGIISYGADNNGSLILL